MKKHKYYVYIVASRSLNLYTGITGNIFQRTLQHKSGEVEGFTKRYNINRLVYYEVFEHVGKAIAREKQIKGWTRAKRLALIKSRNPTWQDLAEGWGQKAELQVPRCARDDRAPTVDKSASHNQGVTATQDNNQTTANAQTH